jgi:hypothetical protein
MLELPYQTVDTLWLAREIEKASWVNQQGAQLKTLRHKLGLLVTGSRKAARQRAQSKHSRKFLTPTVQAQVAIATLELGDLIDIYKMQGGRCAYSRIKLQLSGDWCISLERVDELKGYTRDNVVLVCQEFNTSAQWSRVKFLIAQASIADWVAPPPFQPAQQVVPAAVAPVPAPKRLVAPVVARAAVRLFSIAEIAALKAATKADDASCEPMMQHTPIPLFAPSPPRMQRAQPQLFSPDEIAVLEKAVANAAHYTASRTIW